MSVWMGMMSIGSGYDEWALRMSMRGNVDRDGKSFFVRRSDYYVTNYNESAILSFPSLHLTRISYLALRQVSGLQFWLLG